ncbi:hypothetical protein CNR22_13700 [Sphingobacteriaceae bacterium]|nr:hypothetical protein CNR22_13700 [Sphingobacteriaceae bacterium]
MQFTKFSRDNVVLLRLRVVGFFLVFLFMVLKVNSQEVIGKMIAKQRILKHFTQTEFALLLNVDRQYIWRLENGKINLTMKYLDKIIICLDCVHDDFLVMDSV